MAIDEKVPDSNVPTSLDGRADHGRSTMASENTGTDPRQRQRQLLADLGSCALKTNVLDHLLNEACRLIAEGVGSRFAKVLEPVGPSKQLLVRAGVGWHEGVVGHATIDGSDGSAAGFALETGEPVISDEMAHERRFSTPQLLVDHGITCAINVIIRGDGEPFGVLEADSRTPGSFSDDDLAFMQAAANLLGVAIERTRREADVQRALATQSLLMKEADHRIKNSLQLVASLLTLQRAKLSDIVAVTAFDDAILRVRAVAEAHRALNESLNLRTVAFGQMLADVCRHVGELSAHVDVACHAPDTLEMDVERAIPLGLIVTELLTNAIRHAYAEAEHGEVTANAREAGDMLEITVRDSGQGIVATSAGSRSLGATIVNALAKQVGATLSVESKPAQGTIVTLRLPRQPPKPA